MGELAREYSIVLPPNPTKFSSQQLGTRYPFFLFTSRDRGHKNFPENFRSNVVDQCRGSWYGGRVPNGGRVVISQKELKELLDYDPETGIFRWRIPRQKIRVGDVVGSVHRTGYIRVKIRAGYYSAHRLAWLYVYGKWPGNHIDHINGNRRDNRITNLRDVSVRENGQNKEVHRCGRLPGCVLDKRAKNKNWGARIRVGGKEYWLGTFKTEELAHKRYMEVCAGIDEFFIKDGA
jgi:hypothetical protein